MLYLYAIVGDDHPGLDGASGVGAGPNSGPVYLVPIGGARAAVSEVNSTAAQHDPDVTRYRAVVDRLFRSGTVLPVRLGTTLRDEPALLEQLGSASEEFARRLKTFSGKVEVEVAATYDDELLLHTAEVGARDEVQLSSATGEGPQPAVILQLGEAVSADLERRRAEDGRRFLERIHEVAVAAAERPPEPEMALRASLLVERDRLTELDRVIDDLREDTQGRVTWKVWGPLPPYAFAGLALERE